MHSMARKPFVVLVRWFVVFGFLIGNVFEFEVYRPITEVPRPILVGALVVFRISWSYV